MDSRSSIFFSLFTALAILSHSQVTEFDPRLESIEFQWSEVIDPPKSIDPKIKSIDPRIELHLSPFSSALVALQKQLNYTFQNDGLLRLAMTHSSYSMESNKALSILGANVIDMAVSMQSLKRDIDISSTTLTKRIADVSNVEKCATDGKRLGLEKIVRVSSKTDPSTDSVVCGAFRSIFGAIALDTGKADNAGKVFLNVHVGGVGVDGEVGRSHHIIL